MTNHGYDSHCEELAIYFLADTNPSQAQIRELAQSIQDHIEDELHYYEELAKGEKEAG